MISKTSSIFVAGHRGMVGSAVVRQLTEHGFSNLLLRKRSELDLTSQSCVNGFFAENQPEVVVFAAAKVGGIYANNSFPAEFYIRTWQWLQMPLIQLGSTTHSGSFF
jgi:GDP-L-fucose synthase